MQKRYSKFIRPLKVIIDLMYINSAVFYISDKEYLQASFLIYINVFWLISSFFSRFYQVFRHTEFFRVFSLLAIQFSIFFLGFFTYFSLFREGDIVNNQTTVLVTIFLGITFLKFSFIYALRKYRAKGKNFRKVIVLGSDETAKKITKLFNEKKALGYQVSGIFSDTKSSKLELYNGAIEKSYSFILDEDIDEVYCSISELNKEEVKKITKFTNEHNRVVKLIPNADELYNKNLTAEFYDDSLLVLNVQKMPFEQLRSHILKRTFDIFFSIFVFVFILSWLAPLLWILIKLESSGPAFFKQKREGLNGKQFVCYKFRSMKLHKSSDKKHTTKNDQRVTRLGAFLRKTSLDELPQFFNVLKGEMSVVGPRPHIQSLSIEYQKDVENYIQRHAVKPGITGLAQVRGYRGEIKKKAEIKNRIRLDIFYIENWSFFLDMKIIFQTIFNVFKGDEKAY